MGSVYGGFPLWSSSFLGSLFFYFLYLLYSCVKESWIRNTAYEHSLFRQVAQLHKNEDEDGVRVEVEVEDTELSDYELSTLVYTFAYRNRVTAWATKYRDHLGIPSI